jgi:signal transduction histidine kinase
LTFRRKLSQFFFLILSFQTLLGMGLTYLLVSNLLKVQSRTILEESWNQQNSRFNNIVKQSNTDMSFYKFLFESVLSAGQDEEVVQEMLSRALANNVAQSVVLYDGSGEALFTAKGGTQYDDFSIHASPYSLFDFRFPSTKISWAGKEQADINFGMISGTRISAGDKIFYLIFFTDFRSYLSQISERQPEIWTVYSLPDRILYSDFPELKPFSMVTEGFSEVSIGNDTFLNYSEHIWSRNGELVSLSVLYSISDEKQLMGQLIRITLAVFTFSWIIALIIAIWVSGVFTTPITTLNDSLQTYLDSGFFPKLKYSGEKEIKFLFSTFQGLTEKILEEEAHIRNQMEEISLLNQYNENLMESMHSGLLVVDGEGVAEFCNGFFLAALGLERSEILDNEVLGYLNEHLIKKAENLNDLIDRKIIPSFLVADQDIDRKKTYSLRITPVYSHDLLEKVLFVLEDTTEVDRIWEENLLIDRVSSLSVLSAGMGHEINNPLASMQSHLDFLEAVEKDTEKLDSLRWMREGVERITSIVANTADLMRPSNLQETDDPGKIITETIDLLQGRKNKDGIKFSMVNSIEGTTLHIPEDLFKQLVLNLILNAKQACSPGCEIAVIMVPDDERYISLFIKDNGKGIPAKVLPRVFDPFFSYDKGSEGSGLGLSICFGIVNRFGGTIELQNRKTGGTKVRVRLRIYENTDR